MTTLLPSESNVGTGTELTDLEVFFSLAPKNGILPKTSNAMVEFICDYANRWHSALPSEDIDGMTPNRHLPGTVPMFAYLPSHFEETMRKGPKHAAAELVKKFSREAFWQLRYLFIIVQSGTNLIQQSGHVAVCAISPEAKTIDYLCSSDDDGLIRGGGAQCVETFISLLAAYLGSQAPLAQRFNPCDWKLRTGRSDVQEEGSVDCGLYMISNIMCLAFGWDLCYGQRRGHEMMNRRIRLVTDLLYGGFRGYDDTENAHNAFYYPLNDIKPSNAVSENFLPILQYPGLLIRIIITSAVRNRSPVYYGCPDKKTLYEHCARNARFYPKFDTQNVSGSEISFAKFLSWVERYDLARERKVPPFPKPYLEDGSSGNRDWIPPNVTDAHRPLW
ncbi:aa119a22-624e-4a68-ac29-bea4850f3ccc [Sclerotinia trifoliorum]|uniref:Aa119a22-624e-4a68-ac29-bea4850f3ccc n=1 Tax=Sclerotinia trifoliorum TaxID=28548 RepID=A0A8H2VY69_9HELO|nr:aa119a22-624e-4a68-ac29-bea4850f3ccc [Sclerotinia trifoliorum]